MKISKAAIVRATGYFTFGNSIRKDATALVGSLARSRGNSNVCVSAAHWSGISLCTFFVASCLSKMDLRTFSLLLLSKVSALPSDSRGAQFETVVLGDKLFSKN